MSRVPSPPVYAASRPLLPALVVGSVVLVSLGAAACGDEPTPVTLASASRASVAELVDAPASVTARAVATLSAPADGVLTDLRVDPGDTVTAGQILAVVDSPVARSRLEQAGQALDAAKRAGRGAGGIRRADLKRNQRATDEAAARAFATARDAAGKITEPGLRDAQLAQVRAAEQQYKTAARAADQAVRAAQRGVAQLGAAVGALGTAQRIQAQQAYDLAKSTVDALTLRAPVGGVVQLGGTADDTGPADALTGLLGAAGITGGAGGAGGAGATRSLGPLANPAVPGVDGAVPVGGLVSAGTPIMTVVDLAQLGLVAEVDETDILLVAPGLAATVEFDAATGATYDARVHAVDVLPAAGAGAGVSYRVRLALADGRYPDGRPAPAPRPGMSAVAHLRVRQADDAVTVPAAAVFSTEGRDNVWLVRSGRAERVPVTVGVEGAELVQILDGVQPGQQLVVRGTDRVRTGQQVP
ncbi:efflux RND transporter periplasmic adaptor subunit [Micromonospora sp. NBC_01796]|uniref:efflux RND transporter periplasmic adaptor subunit n=1 Tax=Micromonospora sp. NBC_01796 TaxID=2975987 RepID=UPI002DD80B0E|nr:efflux RND transporter periplasmic adaptor subunit [Micromonospora sp. NBC_01796]WSA89075.1 efflux RND transporter periplasmic adaptor subunit [Micromonospora sp. NBC_01796]